MKKILFFTAGAFLFAAGLWLIAIPPGLINDLIEGRTGMNGLYFKVEGLKKGFFYTVGIEKALLMKKGIEGPLVVLEDVHGSLNFVSLLKLDPEADINCLLNRGRVLGKIKLADRGDLNIRGSDISVSGIPFLELMGIKGDGSISGMFWVKDNKGGIRFLINGLRLKSAAFPPHGFERQGKISSAGIPLPLDLFSSARGDLSVNNGQVEVKSFSMEGEGVYARVRGSIKEDGMDMKLEVMTDSSFKLGNLLGLMLGQYRVSPGYYLIPLRM